MRLRSRHAVLLTAFACAPSVAGATDWQKEVDFSAEAEHDTNPALVSRNEQSISLMRVTPALTLTRVDGTDETQAFVKAVVERSNDSDISPHREDPKLGLSWYRDTETQRWGVNANYEEAATRETELEGSGFTRTDATRKRAVLGGDLSRALNENTILDLKSSYTRTTFDADSFTDYDQGVVDATLWRAISPTLKPFLNLSATNLDPKGGSDSSRLYSSFVGVRWNSSDALETMIQAGAAKVTGASDDNEMQGAVTVKYTGSRTDVLFDSSRTVTTGSTTTGEFATVDQAKLRLTYAYSELTSLGSEVSWRKVDGDDDTIIERATLWAQRELSNSWRVRLGYTYKLRKLDDEDDADAHVFNLTFSYNYSNF